MEATKSQTKSSTANGATKDKSSFFSFGKSVATNAPFFQAKLSINTPGDVYEQQADAVAEHILNSPVQNLISPVAKTTIAPSPIQKDEDGPRQEEQDPLTDGLGILGENLMENNPLFPPFLDRLKYRLWDSQPGELKGSIIGFGIADALILGTVFAMDPRFRGQAINALDGVNLMTPIRLIPNSEFFTPSSFTYQLPQPGHPSYEFTGQFDLTPYFDFLHQHNNAFPQISPRFGLNLDYNPATQSLRIVGGTFNLDLFNRAVTLQGGVNQFFNPNPSLFLPNDPFSQPVTSMLTLPAEQIRDTRFSITIDVPRLINVIRGVPDTSVTRKTKSTDSDTLFRKEEVEEKNELLLRNEDVEEEKREEIFRKEDTQETTTSASAIGDQYGQNSGLEPPVIISRKETSAPAESPALQQVQQALSGNGFSLDDDTKSFMEDRFQHDFSQVKIHDDSTAHQSSSAINALAYTHQNDIVFGAGQFNPSSAEGKKLLAHELTHVVQQGDDIKREVSLPQAEPISGRLILDETATPADGQVQRAVFLTEITNGICTTVDEGLAGTEFSSDNCPFIRLLISRLQRSSPLQIEQMIALYVPAAANALIASEYVPFILARVRADVAEWIMTRRLPAIQEGMVEILGASLATILEETPSAAANAATETATTETATLQRKPASGQEPVQRSPQHILQRLGEGDVMDTQSRSRMERGFGTGFSDVRLHTDDKASSLAGDLNARAFAVGNHIAFASGQHQPGTLIGDALMAHELAHVQQQRGADLNAKSESADNSSNLETEADTSAVHVVARLWNKATGFFTNMSQEAMPRLKTGLKLQSCGGSSREDRIAELDIPDAPVHEEVPVEPPPTVTPVATAEQPIEYLDLQNLEFEPVTDSNSILYILSGPRLYVLPASGIVNVPLRVRGQTTPQRGPFFSMPAVGHAGLHLIQTGEGTGVLFDAGGTRQGQPQILLPASLQALRNRYGITNITGALLSHGHADHVSSLPLLIRTGQISASQVIVHAGLGNARSGPLARVWTELQSSSFTSMGYGPSWNPTSLQTIRTGSTTDPTLRTTLTIGTARFEIITLESALDAHNRALLRGISGSSTADASSLLTRVTNSGASYDVTIVGDLRGRDLLRLHDSLGTTEFNRFFQNTRVLTGLHHLGAVSTADDVRGLQRLMEAVGAGRYPITVVSQTGDSMNSDLVRMLQQSGVRVITLPDLDPARLRTVVASSAGPVRAQGASEFGAEPIVSAAQQRVAHMERAATLMESLGSLPIANYGQSGTGLAASLRLEISRITQLLSQRVTDALSQLNAATRTTGFEERLQQNNTAITRLEGAEALLGSAEVQRLSRLRTQADEIRTRLEVARRTGEYNLRLRSLIAEVGPETARELLIDPMGRPMSVRQQRRTRRAAEAALTRQARTMRALTTRGSSPMPARARGAAWFGIAMELWNIVGPMVEEQMAESRRADQLDFYRFLNSLIWWGEKGMSPPVVGDTGGAPITDPAILSLSIQRRQYDDLPRERRDQVHLPAEVLAATPLQRFYIPPPSQWGNQSVVGNNQMPQDTFWDLFSFWCSTHVISYEDFASEFIDPVNKPIRPLAGQFGTRRWEMQWGSIGTDGHVTEQWEQSDRLSVIMNAAENRSRVSLNNSLATQWDSREAVGAPRYRGPSIGSASTSPQQSGTRPTNMGRVLRGSRLYTYFHGEYVEILHSRIDDANSFSFLVFQNDSPATGFVLLRAGDFDTYRSLRELLVWRQQSSIEIPRPPASIFRDPSNVYFDRPEDIPLDQYLNAEEARALELVRSSQRQNAFPPGFFYTPYSRSESGVYRGKLDIWINTPNEGGFVFARREDVIVS